MAQSPKIIYQINPERDQYLAWYNSSQKLDFPIEIKSSLDTFYNQANVPNPLRFKINTELKMIFNEQISPADKITIINKLRMNHNSDPNFPKFILDQVEYKILQIK
jgi:hypothetical protein